jgi:hypothetical protein
MTTPRESEKRFQEFRFDIPDSLIQLLGSGLAALGGRLRTISPTIEDDVDLTLARGRTKMTARHGFEPKCPQVLTIPPGLSLT